MKESVRRFGDLRNMSKNKSVITAVLMIFIAAMIGIDQLTKYLIVSSFPLHHGEALINNFLTFYYVQNTGSAFSFLADKAWGIYVLSGFSAILSVVVFVFLIKSVRVEEYLVSISLALLFAGAIGNLIDRIRLRYVVDFIRFDFGSYTFPIFNVADICAVIGTIMLIAIMIFLPKKAEKVW